MPPDVPRLLAAIFEKQVTVTAARLCELLPMSAGTLQAHLRLGHIKCLDFGTRDGPPRSVFTLDQVLNFINSRSFRDVPYPPRANRQAEKAEPIDENSLTFKLAMQREARETELRREYREAVAKYGHFSKRLPPSVGLSQSPLAFAARKRLREEAKSRREAQQEAVAAARLAKKEKRPKPGEDPVAWRKRLAAERRQRVTERAVRSDRKGD